MIVIQSALYFTFCFTMHAMISQRSILIPILLSILFLSGCLESKKPLLSVEQQKQWFETDTITLIELDRKGSLTKNPNNERPEVIKLSYRNNEWRDIAPVYSEESFYMKPNGTPGKSPLVFSPIPGKKGVAIAQEDNASSYRYYLVRRFRSQLKTDLAFMDTAHDEWVGLSQISLQDSEISALEQAGVDIKKIGRNQVQIVSKADLDSVIDLVLNPFLAAGTDPAAYDKRYVIASKPALQSDMVAVGKVAHCLTLAGHPDDEHAMNLKLNNMGGVALGDIPNTDAASACDQAHELLPEKSAYQNSVLYAMARIMIKRKRYDQANALLAKIDGKQFPLKIIADASLVNLTAENPGDGAKEAFKLIEDALGKLELDDSLKNAFLLQKANLLFVLNDNGERGAARETLQQLINDDYHPAAMLMSKALRYGWGGPVNNQQSKQLMGAMYEKNVPESYLELGKLFYFGQLDVAQDLPQAYSLFSRAHRRGGFKEAHYMAGFMEMYGQGVERDVKAGFGNFTQALKRGHTAAEGEIGRAYYLGHGTKQNKERGVSYLQKAADAGDANAKQYLGFVTGGQYEQEAKERQKVVDACASGEIKQCISAGYMLERGQGGELDQKTAATLYTQACDSGLSQGCYNAGVMYSRGRGVRKSIVKARSLYELGCKNNYIDACFNLANSLWNEENPEPPRARLLFDKVCKADDARGCYNLGVMQHSGAGGEKLNPAALFEKACKAGIQQACSAEVAK